MGMTVPAKIVTASGEILTSPINLLGSGVNTAGALFDVLKNTAKVPLQLLEKNPLKKATRKAIGNNYKNDWVQYISHQKKGFNDYIAPVKKNVWHKTKRPSKALGNITHAVTGGLEIGVATALDTTWRGIKTPFAAIGNIFKKKENRTKVWENYKEKNKTRLQRFKDGFAQLNAEKEIVTEDAKKKIEETLHAEKKEKTKKDEKKEESKIEEKKVEEKRNNKNDSKQKQEVRQPKDNRDKSSSSDQSKDEQQKEKTSTPKQTEQTVNYSLYDNDEMKDVLENKLSKYVEGDTSKFKVLYPGSSTDTTPARVFKKDKVTFLDKNKNATKKLADHGYDTITKDIKDYNKEYDLVIDDRSQAKPEYIAKNIKKGGYVVVENAHAHGNYYNQSEKFNFIANLTKDTVEKYKKVPEDNPITSGDTNYYLFQRIS